MLSSCTVSVLFCAAGGDVTGASCNASYRVKLTATSLALRPPIKESWVWNLKPENFKFSFSLSFQLIITEDWPASLQFCLFTERRCVNTNLRKFEFSCPDTLRPGSEADHSSSSGSYAENEWSYTSTPACALMPCTESSGAHICRSTRLYLQTYCLTTPSVCFVDVIEVWSERFRALYSSC